MIIKYTAPAALAALCLETALAAPPPNDNRASAAVLVAGEATAGTTLEATPEDGDPAINEYHSVWYRWTAGAGGYYAAKIQYPPAAVNWSRASVRVFRRAADGAVTEVARDAFASVEAAETRSEARFFAEPGGDYEFFVSSPGGSGTPFTLTLAPFPVRAERDDFENAGLLGADGGTVSVTGATRQPGEPAAPDAWQGTVWMNWTAPGTGWYLARVDNPAGSAVDVWRGATLATLTTAAAGMPPGLMEAPYSRITFRATAGETVRLRVLTEVDGVIRLSLAPAAAGDHFDDPLDAGSVSSFERREDVENLTVESGETTDSTGSLWVRWVAPDDAVYRTEVVFPRPGNIIGREPRIKVWQGDSLATLTASATVPLGIVKQPVFFRAVAGREYRFQAGITPLSGYLGMGGGGGIFLLDSGKFTFRLQRMGEPPANDTFASAAVIGQGTGVTVTGTNVAATLEPGETVTAYEAGDSVWHRWTAPAGGGRWEALLESPALLKLQLYRGATLGTQTLVGSQSQYLTRQDGAMFPLSLRWTAVPGETVYFRLSGRGYGTQGAYNLTLRKLNPPENITQALATTVSGPLPVSSTGSTVDAGPDVSSPTGTGSSVWWKWTAPADGWARLTVTGGTADVRESGVFATGTSATNGMLRFLARSGHTYHIQVTTPTVLEGPVSWTLSAETGLTHTLPGEAADLGNAATVSSPPYLFTTGPAYAAGAGAGSSGYVRAGVWYRWTAPAAGWVSFDTEGSGLSMGLRLHSDAETSNDSVVAESNGWPVLPYPEWSSGAVFSRILWQVTAGETLWLEAIPLTAYDIVKSAPVVVNILPAAAPPSISTLQTRELTPLRPDQPRFVEMTLSVVSPNGFAGATGLPDWPVPLDGGPIARGFTFREADRVSGDAFAGTYRAVREIPSGMVFPEGTVRVDVADVRGGSVTASPSLPGFIPDPLPALPARSTDTIPPVLQSISGLPAELEFGGEAMELTLRLSIADLGGSGFLEGSVYFRNDAPGTYSLNGPFREWPAVNFGAAQRVRGDAAEGIYEVTLTIPAHLPLPGSGLYYSLRDAAGNRPNTYRMGGDILMPVYELPVAIEAVEGLSRDMTAPFIAGAAAVYEPAALPSVPYGVVRLEATLSDDLSGVAGGTVSLVDANGAVERSVTFDARQRISGGALSGVYQIVLPVPSFGFGGRHTVRWTVRDGAGALVTAESDPVTLPDRTGADQRKPRLQTFGITPVTVDLTAGPADITVTLGATDDLPGLTGELTILDSRGALLSSTPLTATGTTLDRVIPLTLPVRPVTGASTEATVLLTLRDAAGRGETWGLSSSPTWPVPGAARLTLAPAPSPALQRWAADVPGYTLPSNLLTDTDGDGLVDLVEFALGLDPLVKTAADSTVAANAAFYPTAALAPLLLSDGRDPRSGSAPAVWLGPAQFPGFSFAPAAGFVKSGASTYTDGAWQITVESTADLLQWNAAPLPDRDAAGRVNLTESAPAGPRWYRLKVAPKP